MMKEKAEEALKGMKAGPEVEERKNQTNIKKPRYQSGAYHCDYSPRYGEAFDIYEKAKRHMKEEKKRRAEN